MNHTFKVSQYHCVNIREKRRKMVKFNDRLKGLLFLEFNKDKAAEVFNAPELDKIEGDLFIPINPEFLVKEINESNSLNDLPLAEFITGMTYSLGADPEFKYGNEYVLILKKYDKAVPIVKQKISELVRDKKLVDAFILLSGLYEAIGEEEIENALLTVGEELVISDSSYSDNVLSIAEKATENGNITGKLIEGSVYRLLGNTEKALRSFTEYVKGGGEVTDELSSEMEALTRNTALDEGYSLILEKPEEALKQLLPMYKTESNNPRYLYSIAVAYRNLENYDKAIYYLEEARAIDSGYIDVLNELGLNYSMLNDYTTAEKYFRAVYEASMDLGPLTNLIITLFNLNKNDEAYNLYLTALRKAPSDEILKEIKKFYIDKN